METKQEIIRVADGTRVRVNVQERPDGKTEYVPVHGYEKLCGEVAWMLISLGNKAMVVIEDGRKKIVIAP